MRFPEAILVPVLMLADYFLTLAGAAYRERAYADHFKVEQYELNPAYQKDVAMKRWFNPRHLLGTALVSGMLIGILERGVLPRVLAAVLLGALLVVFGSIVGRHINNLLVFHHVAQRRGEVTGAVTMTHGFALSSSLYQTVMLFVPISVLAAVTQNPWLFGAVLGLAAFVLSHLVWMHRPPASSSS